VPNILFSVIEERDERPDCECLGEQPVAQLAGLADRAQGHVQDRDPVAEPLGLLQPVRGEEDGNAALAEPVDQIAGLRPEAFLPAEEATASMLTEIAGRRR
jgi:hypothetical protein